MGEKLFGRKIELKIGDKKIEYPGLEIEFEIKFSDDDEGNAGHVRLFNLSKNTLDSITTETKFKLKAGYKEKFGLLLPGLIEVKKTKWQGMDKETTLIVGDDTDLWMRSTINRTWKSGKTASDIIPDVINNAGLEVGEVDTNKSITYEKGLTLSTTTRKALKRLAEDTESKLHSKRGLVYVRPPEKAEKQAVLVNSNTGLISSPEKVEESSGGGEGEEESSKAKYMVKMLLNYEVRADSLLKIESRNISGEFRVISGKHVAEGDEFSTECEVEKI